SEIPTTPRSGVEDRPLQSQLGHRHYLKGLYIPMKHTIAAALLAVMPTWTALGQSTTTSSPSFEIAAVKANVNDGLRGKARILPGGRVDLHNLSLKELIMAAYGVQSDMSTGGPKWLDADRFDIIAKAPPNTPEPTVILLLQTILTNRF